MWPCVWNFGSNFLICFSNVATEVHQCVLKHFKAFFCFTGLSFIILSSHKGTPLKCFRIFGTLFLLFCIHDFSASVLLQTVASAGGPGCGLWAYASVLCHQHWLEPRPGARWGPSNPAGSVLWSSFCVNPTTMTLHIKTCCLWRANLGPVPGQSRIRRALDWMLTVHLCSNPQLQSWALGNSPKGAIRNTSSQINEKFLTRWSTE